MARVKADQLPVYAKSDAACWKVEGLSVEAKTEGFKASPKGSDEQIQLTATFNQVKFPTLAVATSFFGSVENLLSEAADSVNAWLQIQGKNKAKTDQLGFEQKVADAYNAALANFIQARGAASDEQKTAIKAKVRARLEELERLSRESVDLADIS